MGRRIPTADDAFDGHGCLTNACRETIRRRAAAHGAGDLDAECRVLARMIGIEDPVVVWAMLMWNAPPTPEVADRLRQWIARGMPLPEPGQRYRYRDPDDAPENRPVTSRRAGPPPPPSGGRSGRSPRREGVRT